MWLRYGVYILLAYNAYALVSSDEETAAWTLSSLHTEPKKIDLTPTHVEKSISCMSDENSGYCVPYYQCDSNNFIREDGSTLINIRKPKRLCPSTSQVCCLLQVRTNELEDNHTNSVDMQTTFSSVDLDKCGWTNIETATSPSAEKAINQEFRWMIAIVRKTNDKTSPKNLIGGGSLIHPSVVITAAHKVFDIKKRMLQCRAGIIERPEDNVGNNYQDRSVNNVTVHPGYYRTPVYNDVALLFLKERFYLDVGSNIGLACLNKALPKAGTECFTMGWGMMFKDGQYAKTLKKIKVPLVDARECETNLRTTRLGPYYEVHSSLTCAGGNEGVDACEKDGGSSLVCPIEQDGVNVRYAMVGMVAYGVQCGHNGSPGVYVNIPALYSWVDEVMTNKSYGTVTYTI